MDRRELLKMIVAATGAAMVGLPALVQGQAPAGATKIHFSDTDVATLDEIAETILPRTRTPGAKDAGAGLFMATFVSDCYTARQQATFRAGLTDIDKRAGGRFVSLTPEARTELLRTLDAEAKARHADVTETGTPEEGEAMPHYFTMLKQLAIFGFFTSKVGATGVLQYVAVPGRYDGDLAYVPRYTRVGDQLMERNRMIKPLLIAATVLAAAPAFAQAAADPARDPKKTEVWTPVPATVATPPGKAPSDAIVLFDGKDVSAWESEQGGRVPWKIADGAMTVVPGSKGIRTRQRFCDVQLHVEWRTPTDTKGFEGQNRGNSGIFLQELYELQVLDSYNNPTYANGQAGSIYKQAMPLVNAARAPGEWQAYDILWKAPRFSQGGGLVSPARITVLHNGVLVQDDTVLAGKTEYIGAPSYAPHGCAPLYLQEHDSKVSYRNIWVREL